MDLMNRRLVGHLATDEEAAKMHAEWETRSKASERLGAVFHLIQQHGSAEELNAATRALKPLAIALLEKTA